MMPGLSLLLLFFSSLVFAEDKDDASKVLDLQKSLYKNVFTNKIDDAKKDKSDLDVFYTTSSVYVLSYTEDLQVEALVGNSALLTDPEALNQVRRRHLTDRFRITGRFGTSEMYVAKWWQLLAERKQELLSTFAGTPEESDFLKTMLEALTTSGNDERAALSLKAEVSDFLEKYTISERAVYLRKNYSFQVEHYLFKGLVGVSSLLNTDGLHVGDSPNLGFNMGISVVIPWLVLVASGGTNFAGGINQDYSIKNTSFQNGDNLTLNSFSFQAGYPVPLYPIMVYPLAGVTFLEFQDNQQGSNGPIDVSSWYWNLGVASDIFKINFSPTDTLGFLDFRLAFAALIPFDTSDSVMAKIRYLVSLSLSLGPEFISIKHE
jgi:hypothetical protein